MPSSKFCKAFSEPSSSSSSVNDFDVTNSICASASNCDSARAAVRSDIKGEGQVSDRLRGSVGKTFPALEVDGGFGCGGRPVTNTKTLDCERSGIHASPLELDVLGSDAYTKCRVRFGPGSTIRRDLFIDQIR